MSIASFARSAGAMARLLRLHQPVGSWLLLWPTVWALVWAAHGMPNGLLVQIFVLGVIVMRSLGCAMNDYQDQDIDGRVLRTKNRPLVNGELSVRQVKALMGGLLLMAGLLWLSLDFATELWALAALGLAAVYPLMKRFFVAPQLVLGLAFSWSIPMAFQAVAGHVPTEAWWLFAGSVCWTMGYDSSYAMSDKPDDIALGIHSTALWWGKYDRVGVIISNALALVFWGAAGMVAGWGWSYAIGLAVMAAGMAWQCVQSWGRDRQQCFLAFRANQWLGGAMLLGIAYQFH